MGDATTAHLDRQDRTVNSAATRAEAARLRVAELKRRREELAAGHGATAQTVATARFRAGESLRRAQQAREAADHAALRSVTAKH